MKSDSRAGNLLPSGIIFSAVSFLTLLVHYVFQIIVSPQLGGSAGEYGLVLATITFIGFLGLPLTIATQAVTHYIARFHFSGDERGCTACSPAAANFFFTSPSPARSSPSFSSSRWAIISIFRARVSRSSRWFACWPDFGVPT